MKGFERVVYDVTEIRRGLSLMTGEIGCETTMHAEIRLLTEYTDDAL